MPDLENMARTSSSSASQFADSDNVPLTNRYRGAVLPFWYVESNGPQKSGRPGGASEWDEAERKIYKEEARATRRTARPTASALGVQLHPQTPDVGQQQTPDAKATCHPLDAEAGQPSDAQVPQQRGWETTPPAISGSVAQTQAMMPWQRFAPRSSADVCGQDGARAQASRWFSSGAAHKASTLFASALVLQGPSGCGKSCLARCVIEEAGYAVVEFGPHTEVPLPQFLRNLGAVDCEGRKTCLLMDDLPQIMEQKANLGAGTARVHYPVVCTADFIVRRTHAQYGCVVSMYALRPMDLKLILERRLGPALRLQPRDYGNLVEGARGDARQLCLQAAFTSSLSTAVLLRDAAWSPWEHARVLLGGRTQPDARRAANEEIAHQSYCLLQENFGAVPGVSIEAAAGFAADLAFIDVLDKSGSLEPGVLAGRSCLRWRGANSVDKVRLSDYGGWAAEKKRSATHAVLLQERYESVGLSLSQLAMRSYGLTRGKKRTPAEARL